MSIWQAVLLGLLQGVAEFLPISSSGHLNVGHHLFGLDEQSAAGALFFDVMVHVGTVVVVVFHYRRSIWRYLVEFASGTARVCQGGSIADEARRRPGFRLALLVIVTMLPLAPIAALKIDDWIGNGPWSASMAPVAICFLVTATILFMGNRPHRGGIDLMKMGVLAAVCVGLAQATAVLPGLSRSGLTISMALLLGLEAAWAVEFSMLISVPAILGAALVSACKLDPAWLTTQNVTATLAGMATAMVVGYFALVLLVRLTRGRRLSAFSYYLWPLGLVLLARAAGLF